MDMKFHFTCNLDLCDDTQITLAASDGGQRTYLSKPYTVAAYSFGPCSPLMGVTRVYNSPDSTFAEIVAAKLCLAAAVSNNIKNLILIIDNQAAMKTIQDCLIYEIKDSPSLQSMSDKYHATAIFHDIHRLSTSFNYLTIVWQRSHVTNTSETNVFSYLNSAADALCTQELEATFRTMGKPPIANQSHYLNY